MEVDSRVVRPGESQCSKCGVCVLGEHEICWADVSSVLFSSETVPIEWLELSNPSDPERRQIIPLTGRLEEEPSVKLLTLGRDEEAEQPTHAAAQSA